MVKECRICGRDDNRIQIRAGSGICCNICEKIEKVDIDREDALDYLWSINTTRSLSTYHEVRDGASRATASEA